MSYQVLARKWRPRNFAELVGQQHVVQALSHALDHNALHPAILLSGTRGVGKTTLARIIAKSLNCEQGVSASPCGQCGICQEIEAGSFIDLFEVDAASQTKVDETRELLEQVAYSPARGRYKLYLIDEVHMLSNSSFNAMLKTLEEPPEHVKFVLATTDPQRLPITVLSRCLQFHLRRLPVPEIAARMAQILEAEGIEFEAAGLSALARAAQGSLRDGLSLLDQAIAFSGGKVASAAVETMLGDLPEADLLSLIGHIAAQDAKAALALFDQMDEKAPDYERLLANLASLLLELARSQQLGAGPEQHSPAQTEQRLALGQALSPQDVQLYYQIAINGRRDLPWAPEPRAAAEMTLLRMLAFHFAGQGAALSPSQATAATPSATQRRHSSAKAVVAASPGEPDPATAAPLPPSAPEPAAAPPADSGAAGQWDTLLAALKLRPMDMELLRQGVCETHANNQLRLRLPAHLQAVFDDQRQKVIQSAVREQLGASYRVEFNFGDLQGGVETPAQRAERQEDARQQAAQLAIEEDPVVQQLRARLGAEVAAGSIKPVETQAGGH